MRLRFAAAFVAALALGTTARADILTQWNFNDSSDSPNVGAGSIQAIGGVVHEGFNSGNGSTDPVQPGLGYQTRGYAAQGQAELTAGVEVTASTLGYFDIVISWDQRHSNTASRYAQFQYTTNGTDWINFGELFVGDSGDAWFNNRTVDLSGVEGVDDNADFGFRIVSAFAPGTSEYAASNLTSAYAATGTWRFDMVTISGTLVPEPGSIALLGLGGLGLIGVGLRRRMRAAKV